MIVQTAAEATATKVIRMRDHLALADQFGRGFGNKNFATLCPRELMEFVAANHDAGWHAVDDKLGLDADTHLPLNLLQTPLQDLIKAGPNSVVHNQAHHPFCGLMVSLHVCGLYNGRFGLSDKIVVDALPEDARPMFQAMLDNEVRRQERLKAQLAVDPAAREWIEERMLFHNYKILQFFDTLALYFCMEHAGARQESTFANVPRAVEDDVTVTVTPVDESTYRLNPFPFSSDPFVVTLTGTHVTADPTLSTAAEALAQGVSDTETITLIS